MEETNQTGQPRAGLGETAPATLQLDDEQGPEQQAEAPVVPVEIQASVARQVTFASHQNDVAVIADLAILNNTCEPIEDLHLKLVCEPALVAPRSWTIDRVAAKGELRLKDRKVSLEGAILSGLTERRRGEITLDLLKGDETIASWRQDFTGLAHNEWGGISSMPELLAAFVMPNDPAVSNVLKEASEVLRRAGQTTSLEGYQSRSRQRVWQIASAIWSAVAARRLTYVEPPASFERQGQKIRTPGEVLGQGLATCLDAAVFFAAALEQAGFNPLIVFTKGHAFCGLWLQPQELQGLLSDDATELRKHEALKELLVFETTMVTQDPPGKFSQAIAAGSQQISEEFEGDFIAALDVRRARQQQIRPLSTVVERKEGEKVETVIAEGLEEPPSLPAFDLGIDLGEKPDTPETRLEHWKRKLLDLTKRNRLLNLKPSKTAIKLICPDPAALEDKLAAGTNITVRPLAKLTDRSGERDGDLLQQRLGSDFARIFAAQALERNEVVSDMEQKDLDAGLVQLYRKAKSDLQEGGANTLFLALGVLRWKQSPEEERSYRAPLILVPVRLERRSAASKVRIVLHDDEPVFNMTLLEMLRQDFDLRLTELEGELPKDESGVDVTLIWNIVRRAVRDVPGFEVVEETVLSTFSFAKYLMWKDISDRTEALKQSPFVKHLIDNPRDPYGAFAEFLRPEEIDEKINPAELYMPLPADSSQIVAVHASSAGGDFVLEGPPGTGKSQTIANIIAHNLGLGRRVLFVSEKMAALEVVYQRLVKEGLGNFCLELHSTKANKKDVLNQLGNAWHGRSQRTQEDWHAEASRLKGLREDLNGLVRALHRPGVTGISPRAAIGRIVRYQNLHRLQLSWKGGLEVDRARNREGLARLRDIAQRLGMAYGEIGEEDKKAFATLRQADWSNAWQARFVEAARALVGCIEALLAASARLAAKTSLPDPGTALSHLMGLATIAVALPTAARRNLAFALGGNGTVILENLERALTALEDYRAEKQKLSQDWGDQAIANAPIATWKAEWAAAQEKIWPFGLMARRGVTGRMRAAGGFKSRPRPDNDLPLLEGLQDLRRTMDAAAAELPDGSPWRGLETDVERARECIKGAAAFREGLARLARSPEELMAVRETLRRLAADGQDLLQAGMPIADAAEGLAREVTAFEKALKSYIQEAAADEGQGGGDLADLRDQAKGVLDLQPHINTWCRWQAVRREAEASGLEDLVAGLESGLVTGGEAAPAFETAYCGWIAGRLVDERPELRTFSSLAHEEKIKAFRDLDAKLSKLSIDYIRARLSGDIPSPADPNRSAPYGILARELQKQRAHKPVRQLIGELGDVVTALTPCLLMSPLSVAQFLSTDSKLFDLVVFDEASQITVWDAIGAIARGTNVIVVGDPKQMPPTSFFDRGASEDEGEEGGLGEDLESILDEALAASVKWHRLTGHYRSRHESLIAFSNHRYYGGDLVTYPSNETKPTAVTFKKVEGHYQRGKGRTNPDEAKAVVREILRRLKDPELCQLSIGVVTLNSEQQRLLDDLLDQERRRYPDLERFFGEEAVEPVFVKNLETVQGDQRDVILLSVGYGPDTPGARTMSMNFGPLNKKGGERRLNVAITRATTEVVIFASFAPSMIDLTRTSAAAVRDLKHYLEFAERGPAALGEALQAVGGETAYESNFEEAVADGLRRKGWTVHTQIGVSRFRIDLGVVHPDQPGRYLAGVECDGATYHASPSARDRDRVRQAILENLNWRLVRIWSTDFFIDAAGTLERVDQKLRELLEVDRAVVAANVVLEEKDKVHSAGAPQEDNGIDEENLEEDFEVVSDGLERESISSGTTTSANLVRFARQQDGNSQPDPSRSAGGEAEDGLPALDPDRFNELGYRSVIQQLGLSIIDQEGPVTFDYLATRIARAHGFRRTGGQIRRQVAAALSHQRRQSQGPGDEKIYWPDGREPEAMISFRGMSSGGAERAWTDLPDPEKLGLARRVLTSGPHSDAPAVMAGIIGLGRLRQKTREEFEELLRRAAALQDKDGIGGGGTSGVNY